LRISKTTEYALRILLTLAASRRKLTCREISSDLKIPYKYVGKLMSRLTRQNLLYSTRGNGGGFQLSRPASQIYLAEVLQIIDGLDQFDQCLLGFDHCEKDSFCCFHHSWMDINRTIKNLFINTSLEDIVKNRTIII
jgi:Rrf2 family protein